MKTILILLLISLVANQYSIAQNNIDTLHKSADIDKGHSYLEKSHRQRSGAVALLVVGSGAIIAGLIGASSNTFSQSGDIYGYIFLGGVGMSLGSIPLFIAAHRNTKKAEYLLRYENIPLSKIVPGNRYIPGIAILFNFK